MKILLVLIFAFFLQANEVFGQDKVCGSPRPSESQLNLLDRLAADQSAMRTAGKINYIPIKPHIVRKSDGSGGVSLEELNQTLVNLNNTFRDMNVEFFISNSGISYINNSRFYNFKNQDESLLANPNDVDDAINLYFMHSIQIDGFGESGGYAYYPGPDAFTNRVFVVNSAARGGHMLSHELGHYFGLVHTFEREGGTELVTRGEGANCTYSGDRICDTAADPYGLSGVTIEACTYTGTIKDSNGDSYTPPLDNIMSYYNHCAQKFTPGQFERMKSGLRVRESQKSYNLEAEPVHVNAPENLSVSKETGSFTLRWTDRSDNETGFIVERSETPNDGFIPIIGLAPNSTSFIDKNYETITEPYYRVKASNSPLSHSKVANYCPAIKDIVYLNGETEICLDGGLKQYHVNLDENVFYEWKVSSGGTVISRGHMADIVWDKPGNHKLSVTPINACGRGNTLTKDIVVSNSTSQLDKITGQEEACIMEYTYSVEDRPGTKYHWNVSGGGNLVANGNTATIKWNGKGLFTVSATPENACGMGKASELKVNVLEESSFNNIGAIKYEGDVICVGKQTYSVEALEGVEYDWSIPTGSGSVVSTGATAIVEWTKPGTHLVAVVPKNFCGSGTEISQSITVVDNKEKPQINLIGSRLQTNSTGRHNWYLNDELISGANGPVCPATLAGTYMVEIVNECGTGPISDAYILANSIEENQDYRNVNLYPNPATDELYIELPNDVEIKNVSIVNGKGELLLVTDRNLHFESTIRGINFKRLLTLDLHSYAKGMYVLKIETPTYVINKRFILR